MTAAALAAFVSGRLTVLGHDGEWELPDDYPYWLTDEDEDSETTP